VVRYGVDKRHRSNTALPSAGISLRVNRSGDTASETGPILRAILVQWVVFFAVFGLVSCHQEELTPANTPERFTITWWSTNRASAFDIPMSELPVYQAFRKRTGTEVSFIHPPVGQYDIRFHIMLSSGKLPDVISHDFVTDYPHGILGAVEDGIIRPIDETLLRNAPNLRTFLEDHPEIEEALTLPQGGLCCVPSLNVDTRTSTYIGPFIRTDLLEKHDLEPPETIAEWETVLARFADDPGIEIPLMFYGGKLRDTAFLAGTFDTHWSFYVTDESVRYGPADPAFREFVTVLRRWYQNGWIDPGVLFNSRRAYDSTVQHATVGIYIDYVSAIMQYQQLLQERTPDARLEPLIYPRRDASAPIPAGHDAGHFVPFAAAYITTSAEDPGRIVEALDYAWSDEGCRLFNFGIEGASYDMIDNTPVFRDELFAHDGIGGYKYYIVPGPYPKDPDSFLQSLRLPAQRRAIERWTAGSDHGAHRLPYPLIPASTSHPGPSLLDLKHELDRYSFEVVIDFISGKTGDESIGNLREDLLEMGLADVLSE